MHDAIMAPDIINSYNIIKLEGKRTIYIYIYLFIGYKIAFIFQQTQKK